MLLFTLLVTGIISLLTWSIYYSARAGMKSAFENRLLARANSNLNMYGLLGDGAINLLHRLDTASILGATVNRSIVMYSEEGKILYLFNMPGSRPLNITPDIFQRVKQKGQISFSIDKREAIAIRKTVGNRTCIMVVAGHDDEGQDRLDTLAKILLLSLAISVFITALVSLLFARQLLRPIALIIREVKDISSDDLSHRIQAGAGQDEMSQLANTFNALLERLQESFAIQRRFISNASHELSTPLTSVSSQVEVVLQKERSADEYKEVLFSVREDVQQMRQLTKSLLEIAKTGSKDGIDLNEIRVDEVLLKVVGDVKKLNTEYGVDLEFGEFPEDEKDFVVFGNNDLLYIAIKNLVENGCKYSPGKRTAAELSFSNHKLFIQVVNKDSFIPSGEMSRIFQPFYRGAGTGASRGFGLGLPLAQRIIALHKGTIHVQSDKANGTCFTIELPAIKIFNSL